MAVKFGNAWKREMVMKAEGKEKARGALLNKPLPPLLEVCTSHHESQESYQEAQVPTATTMGKGCSEIREGNGVQEATPLTGLPTSASAPVPHFVPWRSIKFSDRATHLVESLKNLEESYILSVTEGIHTWDAIGEVTHTIPMATRSSPKCRPRVLPLWMSIQLSEFAEKVADSTKDLRENCKFAESKLSGMWALLGDIDDVITVAKIMRVISAGGLCSRDRQNLKIDLQKLREKHEEKVEKKKAEEAARNALLNKTLPPLPTEKSLLRHPMEEDPRLRPLPPSLFP